MFASEISSQLQYYVYRLIDPRYGETFYVGKGTGNRVFSHAKGEIAADDLNLSDKLQRIREIRLAGFDVAHVIHRHGMDEKTAFEVEAALIDAYPSVTNIMGGHHSDDRGVMHSKQIIERYRAEEVEFKHKVLVVKIAKLAKEMSSIYEAARYAWRVSIDKAREVDFIIAANNGIIVGVFVAHEWLSATPENFPDKEPLPKRWGFRGEEAPYDIMQLYLRKRLPSYMFKKGSQSPFMYSY